MALATFDTLEFVDELEKAGVAAQEARAISSAVRKLYESLELVTKADLEKFGMELRHEIGSVRHEIGDLRKDMDAKFVGIEAKFEVLRADIVAMKWMFGIMATGIVALLVKTFF